MIEEIDATLNDLTDEVTHLRLSIDQLAELVKRALDAQAMTLSTVLATAQKTENLAAMQTEMLKLYNGLQASADRTGPTEVRLVPINMAGYDPRHPD